MSGTTHKNVDGAASNGRPSAFVFGGSRRRLQSGVTVLVSRGLRGMPSVTFGVSGVGHLVRQRGLAVGTVLVAGSPGQWAVVWCATCHRVRVEPLQYLDLAVECVCGAPAAACDKGWHTYGVCPACQNDRRVVELDPRGE